MPQNENGFLVLTERSHLQALADIGAEENLYLEFKASSALSRNGNDPDEMCRDVSAFANAAGGQIIYGIEESQSTHKAAKVDDGVQDPKITREWIEQILNSKIQPRLSGVKVERFEVSETGFGIVITVPPTQSGPHQAPDKKYYRRFETQRLPMHDYEIRDIMGRATAPKPFLSIAFAAGDPCTLIFPVGDTQSKPVALKLTIANESAEPAMYTVIILGLSQNLIVASKADFDGPQLATIDEDASMQCFTYKMSIPGHFPIFKERPMTLFVPSFDIAFPTIPEGQRAQYRIRSLCQTPGYSGSKLWVIDQYNGVATFLQ